MTFGSVLARLCPALFLAGSALAGPPPIDRLSIPVTVNGAPVRALLDTGAPDYIILRSVATRLHLPVQDPPPDAKIAPGEIPEGWTPPCTVSLLGASINVRLRVMADPLAAGPIEFIVGWWAVHNIIWDLRLPQRSINVRNAVPADAKSWTRWQIPDLPVLVLESTGTEHKVRLQVDTGGVSSVYLLPAAWAKWKEAHAAAPATIDAFVMPAAGGVVVQKQMLAHELRLGPLVLRNIIVTEANAAQVQLAHGESAVLGIGALNQLLVVLNGREHEAYISAGAANPSPPDYNRLGACFVPAASDADALMAHVVANSPAAIAGIRDGDELRKVNGEAVTGWRTSGRPINLRWHAPAGTAFTLTLRRGRELVQVPVRLRDFLD